MFSAWDGQVPGEAPLTAQQQLAGMGLSAVMHCTWTSQDGQLWPCRCWEEGAKWICSSSQHVMPNTQAFPGLRGSLNRKKAPITVWECGFSSVEHSHFCGWKGQMFNPIQQCNTRVEAVSEECCIHLKLKRGIRDTI